MSEVVVTPPKRDIQGVDYEVALKIAEMLKKGRRYFGSSGAALTHQASNPDFRDKGINTASAKIGLQGERDTTTMLKKWMEDKPSVVLCDSVHIRGWGKEELDEETGIIEGGDTDHVLIIGDEVIIIDSKRWKSKKGYMVGDKGEVLRSRQPFPGGRVNIIRARNMWFDYLDEDAVITSLVHVNADDITVIRDRNWFKAEYRLVEKDRFIELLDEKWKLIEDYDKDRINSTIVAQVAISAVKPYDERTRVFSADAMKTFK